MRWHTPLIPAPRRQGLCELEAKLQDDQGYAERSCLKKQVNIKKCTVAEHGGTFLCPGALEDEVERLFIERALDT